jgi:hypothetical protein
MLAMLVLAGRDEPLDPTLRLFGRFQVLGAALRSAPAFWVPSGGRLSPPWGWPPGRAMAMLLLFLAVGWLGTTQALALARCSSAMAPRISPVNSPVSDRDPAARSAASFISSSAPRGAFRVHIGFGRQAQHDSGDNIAHLGSLAPAGAGSHAGAVPVPHSRLSFRQRQRVHQLHRVPAIEQTAGRADQVAPAPPSCLIQDEPEAGDSHTR